METTDDHVTWDDLVAGLDHVLAAPRDDGALRRIVRRPGVGEREVVDTAELSLDEGLVGDDWRARGSRHTDDGSSEIDRQLTIMGARAAALIARTEDRWALAGDQLYVDLDLSAAHLPPGTRLALGDAVVEITAAPHLGCAKFSRRFGRDAHRFVNSEAGKAANLRGVNARVVVPGRVQVGDTVRRVD